MAKRRILITGANGFFGSRFVQRFDDRFDILATDVDTLDINNEDHVASAFETFKPDLVLHAAAVAATAFCNEHPDLARKINVDGAVSLARAAEKTGAGMVFISSEQVFNGNEEDGPYSEEDSAKPDTVYGETKLAAEGELRTCLEDLWTLRFTWLFGLPERGTGMSPGVVWNVVQSLMAGKMLKERTNEFRGITYVHDLLDRFEAILECKPDLYHVGSRNDLSRYDLAEHCLKLMGLGERTSELLEAVEAPARRDIRLATDKLASLGVSFPLSSAGMEHCISDFRFTL
ncbi:sugar nucleotide-binding protein [uncultured Cohaesibacter sp.]|uniref:SDR family oxidoreductase n=1 Tax=uncultured Cohaesibacter sp. TaxID=1002546 RepID=UPI00292E0BFF|nr:sugar nucleotide-binding protein [uncultured Cohaesibacter sp.]